MKAYKIRHQKTGLYSDGTVCNLWQKEGKLWSSKGHLDNYFALIKNQFGENVLKEWFSNAEIIEYDVLISGVSPVVQ